MKSLQSTNRKCCPSPDILKNSSSLQNILSQIKYLQKYVSIFDATPKNTKKKSRSNNSIKSIARHKCKSLKDYVDCTLKIPREISECKKYKPTKTNRCSSNIIPSSQINNCQVDSLKSNHNQCPMSFISLQFTNLKLQNQNLNLEKQLLQQQLMMQRRDKHLLKNRLKKIKNSQIIKDMSLSKGKDAKNDQFSAQIHSVKMSPIKIKIPQLLHLNQYQQKNISISKKGSQRNKTFQSISVKNMGAHQLNDELLLSNLDQNSINKYSQGRLQQQFWNLLSKQHSKQQNKWQIRSALGDIANKLKIIRKY